MKTTDLRGILLVPFLLAAALAGGWGSDPAHPAAAAKDVVPAVRQPVAPVPPLACEAEATAPDLVTVGRTAALEIEARAAGRALWVPVDCCGDDAVDSAEGFVVDELAARQLPDDAPIFVDGVDETTTLALARRLAEWGLRNVRVVLPRAR